ncbi:metalloregulator ArsR/SmtB family transcription factor [Aliiroseovarius subalbicans]|uniref:ArsR/SmtB family transcription factor n=1 Tax=Aliiroseovarius subalbicans TaxID=2925840 RepID=UPI001F569897|nr:metalloregulator ArsR/SmtB family transcription factor [Aliiroseovarius subalbicans]MCI2398566.1 metalloregulator ArsR/SmtB family transcription factor [Aliiroseovarius subalbicans]
MPDLQPTFRALADPTRRDILHLLGGGDMTIAQVTDHFDMTRAAVKKHLTVLEQGNLIRVRPQGREVLNSLNAAALSPIRDWIGFFDQFWDTHLDALKNAIENKDLTHE